MTSEAAPHLATEWASVVSLRLLCIGNGGLVCRNGTLYVHRYLYDFLDELGSAVEEVCYCGWSEPVDDLLAQSDVSDSSRFRVLGLSPLHGPAYKKWGSGGLALLKLLREIRRCDFAYVFWPGRLSSVATLLCRTLGKPYGIYLRGEIAQIDRARATALSGAQFALASGQNLTNLAKAYCRNSENVTPMVSIRKEHIRTPRAPRQSGPLRLLYVGRIEERKGIFDLVKAVATLLERGAVVELTLVGHCTDREAFLANLSPPIIGRVRMVNAVPDFEHLVPYYMDADVFVLPSHSEGFPRVLYEAMALGVPVMTTFVGSIPSVMTHQTDCLQIDKGDPSSIVNGVELLIENPELRSRLASNASWNVSQLISTWKRTHAAQVLGKLRDCVPRVSI